MPAQSDPNNQEAVEEAIAKVDEAVSIKPKWPFGNSRTGAERVADTARDVTTMGVELGTRAAGAGIEAVSDVADKVLNGLPSNRKH